MIPIQYRAYHYPFSEDRYRTPRVDAPRPLSGVRMGSADSKPTELSLDPLRAASSDTLQVALDHPVEEMEPIFPLPFHISTQWDAHAALRALSPQKFLVALDAWAIKNGILAAVEALALKIQAKITFVHFGALEVPLEIPKNFGPAYEFLQKEGDDPLNTLLAEARQMQASLLILSTHGRTGKNRVLEGSMAEAILKQADIPVLIHRDGTDWTKLKKILLPFDELPHARAALALSARLRASFAADVWLFHVRRSRDSSVQGIPPGFSEIHEVEAQGDIAGAIAGFAAKQAVDLIIMASHREDFSRSLLPEGVTPEVMRRVSCALWVLPR